MTRVSLKISTFMSVANRDCLLLLNLMRIILAFLKEHISAEQ